MPSLGPGSGGQCKLDRCGLAGLGRRLCANRCSAAAMPLPTLCPGRGPKNAPLFSTMLRSRPPATAPADLAPLPMNSPLRSASRAYSAHSADTTPRTRGTRIVSYFSSKLDRVVRLMGGAWGLGGLRAGWVRAGCVRRHAGRRAGRQARASSSVQREGSCSQLVRRMVPWLC